MKILRIITRLNIGGPAIQACLLTKNDSNSILAAGNLAEGEQAVSDIPFYHKLPSLQRGINFKRDIKAIKEIYNLIKEYKPDIIHTHMAKAGFIGRIAGFLYNSFNKTDIKLVHTFHGHVFHDYFGFLKTKLYIYIEKFLAKKTDKIIAISESQKEDLCYKYKIAKSEKTTIIPLGFDLDPFFKIKKKNIIKKEVINIGIVGRLTDIKNHDMFLDAVKLFRLYKPYYIPITKFFIIGDGELKEELEKKSKKLDLDIEFTGWMEPIDIYKKLDVLVLTSKNEGTPVVIIEAMASGVPVISTNVGGVKDLIGDQERGGLFCTDGAVGVAAGLSVFLNEIKKIQKYQVSSARKFIKKYSKENLFKNINNLYEEIS